MRITILPLAIILTKAHRTAVSMMAKGSIVARVLPLKCFLFLLPNYIHGYAIIMQYFSYLDKREVLQQEYSQPTILPSLHLWWVVKTPTFSICFSNQRHNPRRKPGGSFVTNALRNGYERPS